MNGSLIPANTKKSLLLLGFLRPLPDALILGVGVLITVLWLAIIGSANTLIMVIACLPMLISVILVMPIPNYHNTLCVIQSIMRFYNERRVYIWKGWCPKDELKDDK